MNSLWNIYDEEELISWVKINPMLWDPSQVKYRRVDLKETLWEQFSSQMNKPWLTAEAAKKKWALMRDTYRRNVRKVGSSTRTGAGQADLFSPKWRWFEAMGFLRSCPNSASIVSSLDAGYENVELVIETSEAEDPLDPRGTEAAMELGSLDPFLDCPVSSQIHQDAANPSVSRGKPPPIDEPLPTLGGSVVGSPQSVLVEGTQSTSHQRPATQVPTPIEVGPREASPVEQPPLFKKRGVKRKSEDGGIQSLLRVAEKTANIITAPIAVPPNPTPPEMDEAKCVATLVEAKLRYATCLYAITVVPILSMSLVAVQGCVHSASPEQVPNWLSNW